MLEHGGELDELPGDREGAVTGMPLCGACAQQLSSPRESLPLSDLSSCAVHTLMGVPMMATSCVALSPDEVDELCESLRASRVAAAQDAETMPELGELPESPGPRTQIAASLLCAWTHGDPSIATSAQVRRAVRVAHELLSITRGA